MMDEELIRLRHNVLVRHLLGQDPSLQNCPGISYGITYWGSSCEAML